MMSFHTALRSSFVRIFQMFCLQYFFSNGLNLIIFDCERLQPLLKKHVKKMDEPLKTFGWHSRTFWKLLATKISKTVYIFFAAHVICKKNSFSRVVILFFLTKIAKLFHSKINDSSRVRTTGFSSSGFESLSCQIFLWFFPNILRYPKLVKH